MDCVTSGDTIRIKRYLIKNMSVINSAHLCAELQIKC